MQPIPKVTRNDVERVVRRDFAPNDVGEALRVLSEYQEGGSEREVYRVQLAVLKLAAGSMDELRHHIESAKGDYRDVLAWAEYPLYFQSSFTGDEESAAEEQRVIDADWKQYREWLDR